MNLMLGKGTYALIKNEDEEEEEKVVFNNYKIYNNYKKIDKKILYKSCINTMSSSKCFII